MGTVNGVTDFSATGIPQPTLINGQNAVELNVTSDATGTLAIVESTVPGVNHDVKGLQLQATPEPSSPGALAARQIAGVTRRLARAGLPVLLLRGSGACGLAAGTPAGLTSRYRNALAFNLPPGTPT